MKTTYSRPPIDSMTIGRCPHLTLAVIRGVAATRAREDARRKRWRTFLRIVTLGRYFGK